jgi:hypothetical protein
VPYSDRQIDSRAGVTLRIIELRRLGHLENNQGNQATVVCARRDRKNFPTAGYKQRLPDRFTSIWPLAIPTGTAALCAKRPTSASAPDGSNPPKADNLIEF